MSDTISTLQILMQRAFATNSTVAGTSITPPSPTTSEPDGPGVFNLPTRTGSAQNGSLFPHGAAGPNQASLIFFGAGSDGNTGLALVSGWYRTGNLWMPVPFVLVTLTLSTAVGVAGQNVINTDRFADTLTMTQYNGSSSVISNAANAPAMLIVDTFGAFKIQVQTALNSSSTSLNALIGML